MKGYSTFSVSVDVRPRAAILVSQDIEAWPLVEHINKDLVTILVKIDMNGARKEVAVCSAYLPYDQVGLPPTRELEGVVSFCRNKKIPLLIGCDSNSHHEVWGSTGNNARGEALLDFIGSTDLLLLNRGNEPTFHNRLRKEVIDITICSPELYQSVLDWKVTTEPSLSDHRHIRYVLNVSGCNVRWQRNPRKTDWELYRRVLKEKLESCPRGPVNNIDDLEIASSSLHQALGDSREVSCPEVRVTAQTKGLKWSSELARLRRRTRKMFNKARRSGSDADWEDFRCAQREYRKRVRNSSRASWKEFCSNIESVPEASRLYKALAKDPACQLGPLRLPNGSMTEDEKDTLRYLSSVHFPGSLEITGVQEERDPRMEVVPNWALARLVVTKNRILWAVRSFAPFKSAGPDGVFPALLQEGEDLLISWLETIFRASGSWIYT